MSKINETLEIVPGDSVLVVDKEGKLKKLILPEFRDKLEQTPGTEKVLEILQLFDPEAKIETFENVDKGKLH